MTEAQVFYSLWAACVVSALVLGVIYQRMFANAIKWAPSIWSWVVSMSLAYAAGLAVLAFPLAWVMSR